MKCRSAEMEELLVTLEEIFYMEVSEPSACNGGTHETSLTRTGLDWMIGGKSQGFETAARETPVEPISRSD